MEKKRNSSIRLSDETLKKFSYITEHKGYSNGEYVIFLMNECVREFEKEHGKIELQE